MRIVCDSCGAKYQIADEKIAGKLFRVRCKKCSHMIMVDGTQVGGAVAAAAGVGGDDAAWYVVIDGAQTGPLSVAEVQGQVDAGAVTGESYAWREGMPDWLRLTDVPALADALTGLADDEGFADEATRVVDPSAERAAAPSDVAPAPASPAGSGLLAAASASTSSSFFAATDSTARPAQTGASAMTAERNESSVLFSLSDLASSKSKTAKASDDLPRTEGSGLIDIRTLASAQAALAPPTASDAGSASPGAIGTIAPATMAPVALPPRKTNTGLYVALGVIAALLLVVAAGLVFVITQEDPAPVVVVSEPTAPSEPAAPAPEPVPEPAAPVAEPVPTPAEAVAALGSGEGSADPELAQDGEPAPGDEPAEESEPTEVAARTAEPRAEREERRERTSEPAPEREEPAARRAPEPTAEQAPAPTAAPEPRAERDSDAVAAALAAIQRGGNDAPAPAPAEPAAQAAAAAPAVPVQLERSDVLSTLRRYRSRLTRCQTEGVTGSFTVSFVIQRSGAVSNVSPAESDDVSQCLAGVVRDMQFPQFSGDPLPVTYPFRLE